MEIAILHKTTMKTLRSILRSVFARQINTSPLRPLADAIHRIDRERRTLARFANRSRALRLK